MLSRIALNARLVQSNLGKTHVVLANNYSSAPANRPLRYNAPCFDVPPSDQVYPCDQYEGLVVAPPRVFKIDKVVVQTIEECRLEKPIAEQLNVNFGPNMPTIDDDKNPQRDTKNFPRPVQPVDPEPVHFAVIPDAWFKFFHEKTGITGPYAFFGGLTTFLLSKELLIIEHEMVVGLSLAVIFIAGTKKFGKQIADYVQGINQSEVDSWDIWQNGTIDQLKEYIALNKTAQDSLKGQGILFDAKRENIHLQREAEYRRRLASISNEVKRKLDYQIAVQNSVKTFSQKHMVNWIIDNVSKGITPQQEKEALSKCITDLKALAVKRANVI